MTARNLETRTAGQQPGSTPSIPGLTPSLDAYGHTLLGDFDRRFLTNRAAWIAFAVLLSVLLAVFSIKPIRNIQLEDGSPWREGGTRHKTALGRWLPTAQALAEQGPQADPYGRGHWFPTPTLVLIALVPLTKVGYTTAGVIWAALKIIGFLGVMFLLIREVGRDALAVPLGVLIMTVLFGLRPVVGDIQHANLNIFMMIWLTLAWVLYMRKRDFWAGLFIGLAIVTKVTPALLLVFFIYKRCWRVCLGAGVGLLLFALVIPGVYLGFLENIRLLCNWFDMLVAPYALHGYATLEIPNQSLYGTLLRLLSNAGVLSIQAMPSLEAWDTGMEDMVRPDGTLGRLLRPAIGLMTVGALAWLCRGRRASRRDPRAILEFALVLLAMLLLSERTWKHHATMLPIVYLAVWYGLTCLDWSPRFRGWFVGGLVVQLFLLLGTSQGLVGEDLAELLLDGGVFCWGLLLCFVQVGVMLCMLRRRYTTT